MEKGCGGTRKSLGRICTSVGGNEGIRKVVSVDRTVNVLDVSGTIHSAIFTEYPLSAQHCDGFDLGLQRRTGNTYTRDSQSPRRYRRMDVWTVP